MKSVNEIIGYILVFGIIALFAIFSFFFVKNTYTEEIIQPYIDIVVDGGSVTLDNDTINAIKQNQTELREFDFNLNAIFIIVWVSFIIAVTVSAWFLPPLPTWNFFTFLFFGLLIVFLAFNFINQIYQWIVIEWIYNIFPEALAQTKSLLFYTENQPQIILFLILWTLGINQASRFKRNKVEDTSNIDFE